VADNDPLSTAVNTPLTIDAEALLSNDVDPQECDGEGDLLGGGVGDNLGA
jgi:hypothetical protein